MGNLGWFWRRIRARQRQRWISQAFVAAHTSFQWAQFRTTHWNHNYPTLIRNCLPQLCFRPLSRTPCVPPNPPGNPQVVEIKVPYHFRAINVKSIRNSFSAMSCPGPEHLNSMEIHGAKWPQCRWTPTNHKGPDSWWGGEWTRSPGAPHLPCPYSPESLP